MGRRDRPNDRADGRARVDRVSTVHRLPRAQLAALGVVALHTFNTMLLSPRPGVRAGDHVVGLLVVGAVLAAAALAMVRGRPGLRASVSLALAVPCLAGFGLAVADASARGASAADVTGLALVAPGVVLAFCGARELWGSRRAGRHPILRRALVGAAAAVVAFEIVVPVTVALVATQRPRDAETRLDFGAPARDVRLTTADGVRLAASYVPSRNGAAIILFPRRGGAQAHARMLVDHGFGVLALDMRGYGASEGQPNAYGWGATPDLDAAVAFLAGRPEVQRGAIGGLGLSVGGEQLVDAAASNRALRAVVADGAGERSVRETVQRGWRAALVVPQQAVLTASVAVLSGDGPPPSLTTSARRVAPSALMLIEAGRGGGGEERNADYLRAARMPKAHWRIPDATHTGGLRAHPREYAARVTAFFARYLGVSR